MNVLLAALAYIIPTFPLGYVWHLTTFKDRYSALRVYRDDFIPLLGLASMIVQGVCFGLIYVWAIQPMAAGWPVKAAIYAALGGFLSWSFTTVAAVAKTPMTSLREYFALETIFTSIQWIIVGVVTALIVG
jgi:hypothetical protein